VRLNEKASLLAFGLVDQQAFVWAGRYDLKNDDGRDFDFEGYSLNMAVRSPHEPYASVAKQLYAQLKETVPTWL